MRFIWVDAGDDLNIPQARNHGINGAFFGSEDEDLVLKCRNARSNGFAAGMYVGHGWAPYNWGDGTALGEQVAQKVHNLFGASRRNSFPKVQLDIETHDPDFVLDALNEFRMHFPSQDLSWTFEPFQGGWMDTNFVDEIRSLRVRLVPQAYYGNMDNIAEDQILRNLTRRGFDERRISLFYDAQYLPRAWNGFAFTQQRLP